MHHTVSGTGKVLIHHLPDIIIDLAMQFVWHHQIFVGVTAIVFAIKYWIPPIADPYWTVFWRMYGICCLVHHHSMDQRIDVWVFHRNAGLEIHCRWDRALVLYL
jgi:hypothetical protein